MAPAAKREQMSVADSGGGKGLRQDIKVELRILLERGIERTSTTRST
jgi:hypothetical protein